MYSQFMMHGQKNIKLRLEGHGPPSLQPRFCTQWFPSLWTP